jgi:hypothetical protein
VGSTKAGKGRGRKENPKQEKEAKEPQVQQDDKAQEVQPENKEPEVQKKEPQQKEPQQKEPQQKAKKGQRITGKTNDPDFAGISLPPLPSKDRKQKMFGTHALCVIGKIIPISDKTDLVPKHM